MRRTVRPVARAFNSVRDVTWRTWLAAGQPTKISPLTSSQQATHARTL